MLNNYEQTYADMYQQATTVWGHWMYGLASLVMLGFWLIEVKIF